jgi:hypothetical protein
MRARRPAIETKAHDDTARGDLDRFATGENLKRDRTLSFDAPDKAWWKAGLASLEIR